MTLGLGVIGQPLLVRRTDLSPDLVERLHVFSKLIATPPILLLPALVFGEPRMFVEAGHRCLSRVSAEEDPVSAEPLVHDLPGRFGIQRLAKSRHLVLDQRVHRVENQRSHGLRTIRMLVFCAGT